MKCGEIFQKRYILPPKNFKITNYPRDPVAVFNPGAVEIDGIVHVFPRVIFDYYKYTSAIGHFTMKADDILNGTIPEILEIELIIWPKTKEEFLGCEDPRIFQDGENLWILYTAKGYRGRGEGERTDFLALAKLDFDLNVSEKHFLKVEYKGEIFYPKSNKDSAILRISGNKATILTRPDFGGRLSGWRGVLDLEDMVIRDLEEVLPPKEGELKRGWSTNAVEIDGRYLVGWHAVIDEDLSYRNGFALVDENGNILDTTGYVLCTEGLIEELGDRAMVIFGDGLLILKDKVVWIGGVSDYAVGVFVADLEDLMDSFVGVKGVEDRSLS